MKGIIPAGGSGPHRLSILRKETVMPKYPTLNRRFTIAMIMFLVIIVRQGAVAPLLQAADIRIATDVNVDERLFLVRLLENLYLTWPSDASDQASFVAAAGEHRTTAIRMREHCRREKLGAELAESFDEYVRSLDAYTNYLRDIGQISMEAANQAQKDHFTSGLSAGMAGGAALGAVSGGVATIGVIITTGIDYWLSASEKDAARNAATRQRMETLARILGDDITTSLANAQAVARKLAKENGWEKLEVGFDDDPNLNTHLQMLEERRNFRGIIEIYDALVNDRPRDPFIRLGRNMYASGVIEGNPDLLLWIAQDCVETAALIPNGQIYDEYRIQCVTQGAALASRVRYLEVMNGTNPAGSTAASQFAVSCIDWIMENGPRDSTGEWGEARANALLADGQLDASLEQASAVYELRKHSASFCYIIACIMSRKGETQDGLEWLMAAINGGYGNLEHIKADPDLEAIRKAYPGQFSNLAQVKYDIGFIDGIFNDDVYLINYSDYPLTNVKLRINLKNRHDIIVKTYDTTRDAFLEAPVIGPKERYVWKNGIVSSEGTVISKTIGMYCDQSGQWTPPYR